MAQGQTNRLFFENPMTFQLGPTEENPEGQAIVINQGWNEVPEVLKDHPLIKRMKPEHEVERNRRQAIADAEKARNEAVAKAEEEYVKQVTEAEQSRVEEITQLNEERLKRMEEKSEQGMVAYEPHPDPDAARAETLTLPPGAQVIPTAGMAYKGNESVAAAQTRVREAHAPANPNPEPPSAVGSGPQPTHQPPPPGATSPSGTTGATGPTGPRTRNT